ncbi:hypothetical protein G3N59_00435 [Paraburkholderia sp. Ac-20340]|uniref:hypothetical protein n=1 Tax=Paraburkholderia sp. Ac-20340 TaxID=2703888 RepID=UPI00197D8AE3|nr:hypothetical protein [Paraburkholderia sp. Ac-20340]MBN3851831.1 hypothetical protein [Paraburkholderia sp. Ac-20340]
MGTNMRKIGCLSTLLVVSALSGCGVLGPSEYKEPANDDAATLVFSKGGHMLVIPNIYTGAAECTDRTRLPPIPDDGEVVRKIAAGQPISFSLSRTEGYLGDGCVVTATFTPVPNHRYLAQVKGHGTTCHLELNDAGKPGDEYVPPKAVAKEDRKWHRPLSESGPFCTE